MKQNPARKSIFYSHFVLFVVIVCVIIFLLIQATGYQFSPLKLSLPTPTPQAKVFQASSAMDKFTIIVPPGFTTEEKFGSAILKNQDKTILITSAGTNYLSLKEVMQSDADLRTRKVTYIKINNLEAGYEIRKGEKAYYIYNKYAIYSIVTTFESLYSTLDQIAQSFKLP